MAVASPTARASKKARRACARSWKSVPPPGVKVAKQAARSKKRK